MDPPINNLKDYVVHFDAQSNLILIEKRLKHFYYYSFSLKLWLVDQLVRFYDYRDETLVREYFATYHNIKQFKFKLKCLDTEAERYFLSLNALSQVDTNPVEFVSVSNLIVIFELNRCASSSRKIELEILRVFSFVRAVELATECNLLAYNYVHEFENFIKVVDLKKNKTKFELNLSEGNNSNS